MVYLLMSIYFDHPYLLHIDPYPLPIDQPSHHLNIIHHSNPILPLLRLQSILDHH